MIIELYLNTTENERADKSSYLSLVETLDGFMREDCDIMQPSVNVELNFDETIIVSADDNSEIEVDDSDIALAENKIPIFNYAYIPDFHRYYFVRSMVALASGMLTTRLYRLHLVCDVLMSFKDHFLGLKAFVTKNEFTFFPMLPDDDYPLSLAKDITEEEVSTGALVDTTFQSEFENGDLNIVISLSGSGGASKIFSGLDDQLPDVDSERFESAGGLSFYTLDPINLSFLMDSLLGEYSGYSSFFVSAVAFPYKVESASALGSIGIWKDNGDGTFTYTTIGSAQGKIAYPLRGYACIADFLMPIPSTFLDIEPFSHYELWIPFCGWVEISLKDNQGDRILVYYAIDQSNGSAEVYIYNYTKKRILGSTSCQVGVTLAISSSNAQELNAQKQAMTTNLVLGLISSGVSMVGSAYTGNGLGVVMSGINATKQITDYINNSAMMFQKASSTHNGANGALFSPLKVRLRSTKAQSPVVDVSAYNHNFGRPLMMNAKLETLSGFTKVGMIHLEDVPALDVEKEEITQLLEKGVLL